MDEVQNRSEYFEHITAVEWLQRLKCLHCEVTSRKVLRTLGRHKVFCVDELLLAIVPVRGQSHIEIRNASHMSFPHERFKSGWESMDVFLDWLDQACMSPEGNALYILYSLKLRIDRNLEFTITLESAARMDRLSMFSRFDEDEEDEFGFEDEDEDEDEDDEFGFEDQDEESFCTEKDERHNSTDHLQSGSSNFSVDLDNDEMPSGPKGFVIFSDYDPEIEILYKPGQLAIRFQGNKESNEMFLMDWLEGAVGHNKLATHYIFGHSELMVPWHEVQDYAAMVNGHAMFTVPKVSMERVLNQNLQLVEYIVSACNRGLQRIVFEILEENGYNHDMVSGTIEAMETKTRFELLNGYFLFAALKDLYQIDFYFGGSPFMCLPGDPFKTYLVFHHDSFLPVEMMRLEAELFDEVYRQSVSFTRPHDHKFVEPEYLTEGEKVVCVDDYFLKDSAQKLEQKPVAGQLYVCDGVSGRYPFAVYLKGFNQLIQGVNEHRVGFRRSRFIKVSEHDQSIQRELKGSAPVLSEWNVTPYLKKHVHAKNPMRLVNHLQNRLKTLN